MIAEGLLAHYERIAEAPDAITRLRRLVLDLAIRGRLVPQEAEDEPASELLKRITAEKTRLVRVGKLREPKSFVRIDRAALPFVAASHWEWARLIDIADASYGFAFPSGQFNSSRRGMPLIRIRDISSTDTEAYFDGGYDEEYLVVRGDYLVGMDGDFNLRRWNGPDGLLNQRVMRINGWRCNVEPEFLKLPLQFVLNHLHGETSLTTVKHLSAKQVNGIELPLPPLSEQHRIVAKVDELMVLCDRLEAARERREATRDRLTAASFARLNSPDPETFRDDARFALDTLPALTARADQVKQLRQTILNLAVRGKLVSQNAEDVPISVTLPKAIARRSALVRAKKVRQKKLDRYDDLPADAELPPTWVLERLGNLVDPENTISYGVLVPGEDVPDGIPFVRAQDLALSSHPARPNKTISPEIERAYARTRLRGGEILVCVVGSIGKLGIVPQSWAGANIARAVARIMPIPEISREYLLIVLQGERVQTYFNETTRTLAQPTLNISLIEQTPIPLPPLAEQHRIVAKVDELMALCDRLEASLATGANTRSRLLDALLAKALEPAESGIDQAA